jgi:hypothetical protein
MTWHLVTSLPQPATRANLDSLGFLKAWVDCYTGMSVRISYTQILNPIKLVAYQIHAERFPNSSPPLRLRNMFADRQGNGILHDFDVFSAEASVQGHTTEQLHERMIIDLLKCKETCDARAERLANDKLEPAVWSLVEFCLHQGDMLPILTSSFS